MMTQIKLSPICLSIALVALCGAAQAEPLTPAFDATHFASPKPNPYMDLTLGNRHVLAGSGEVDGKPANVVASDIVAGPGPVLMGVQTIQVLDQTVRNGLLIERTFDYYATDDQGNLWYFGEDVTNYTYDDTGRRTGTDSKSAWLAGEGGAMPGIGLPGAPVVGLSQMQEVAPDQGAMDYFEVVETDAHLTGPSGAHDHVMKTFETSLSEPDGREFKYFAPGVGLLRVEDDLSADRTSPKLVMELQPAG